MSFFFFFFSGEFFLKALMIVLYKILKFVLLAKNQIFILIHISQLGRLNIESDGERLNRN